MQMLGKLSKRLKEFKNALLGVPSPEEAARRRAGEELARAFFDGYGKLLERRQELAKRKECELGQVEFLRHSMLRPQQEPGSSRDALKAAVADRMKALDSLKDDWRTLMDDTRGFFKKQPAPPMEPGEKIGFVYDLDGMARAELSCRDMRKAFMEAAIKSGLLCEDGTKIPPGTEAPVRVMKPLRLRARDQSETR